VTVATVRAWRLAAGWIPPSERDVVRGLEGAWRLAV